MYVLIISPKDEAEPDEMSYYGPFDTEEKANQYVVLLGLDGRLSKGFDYAIESLGSPSLSL